MSLILEEIKQTGFEKALGAGIVVTGGTVLLEGVIDVAEQIFDLPVRKGVPAGLGGMGEALNSPIYSTAVGLVLFGYRTHSYRLAKVHTNGNLLSRGLSWFKTHLSWVFVFPVGAGFRGKRERLLYYKI